MDVTKPYRLSPDSQEPERETSVMRACRCAYLCVSGYILQRSK